MRVFYGFDNLPEFTRPVVTVGSYDGVHRGHRELLSDVMQLAREREGESVVVTFSPHPREVLDPEGVELLNTLAEKALLLGDLGVDNLVVVPFNDDFSRTTYYDFVREYLVGKLGVSVLVVGYNHHFGAGKEGDSGSLDELSEEFCFDVVMVERHDVDGSKVSSTIIRNLIYEGDLKQVCELLGYEYFMIASVTAQGRVLPGSPNKLLPPAGSYDVDVKCGEKESGCSLHIASGRALSLTCDLEGRCDAIAVACEEAIITFK